MTKARVSTIITAYNSELFIAEAISSVLKQSRPVDEIIVVDDGSTDGTAALVAQFSDTGVRYVYQENQGASAARNRGIKEAHGNLLTFLDADDIWLENKNQIQVDYLSNHPQVTMVSGLKMRWNMAKDTHRIFGEPSKKTVDLRRDILIYNLVGNPSMITLRREALDQIGLFDRSIRWGQDWELWIRIVSHFEVTILPDPVIIYRIHSKNLSKMKRREVLDSYRNISQRAIQKSQPVWLRPYLMTRSWSHFSHELALDAEDNQDSRFSQITYSIIALTLAPWDEGWDKINTLLRSILGKNFYNTAKRSFRYFKRARG